MGFTPCYVKMSMLLSGIAGQAKVDQFFQEADMKAKIYHNPRCSKSRQTLELLRSKGVEPEIVEYLKNPPDEQTVRELLTHLGISPRELMRKKEAQDCGLHDHTLTDDQLIAGIVDNPSVIERPIVLTNRGAAICRPPDLFG